MVIELILLPGDGYQPETMDEFMKFLSQHGFNCTQIPLIEANPSASYDDLRTENYLKHIDSFIDMKKKYWIFGISKGAHWARVYASHRPNICKLISCEETTMNPRLLIEYEKSRENFFITDYFKDAEEHEELDIDRKSLDSIVSDKKTYFPKCPINVIWTSRNNEDEPYEEKVLMLKRKFVQYLRDHGCHVTVFHLDSNHNCVCYPRNFPKLFKYILAENTSPLNFNSI